MQIFLEISLCACVCVCVHIIFGQQSSFYAGFIEYDVQRIVKFLGVFFSHSVFLVIIFPIWQLCMWRIVHTVYWTKCFWIKTSTIPRKWSIFVIMNIANVFLFFIFPFLFGTVYCTSGILVIVISFLVEVFG